METKSSSKSIGTAVIGLGRGMAHAKAYANAKDCKLLAVCDINKEKANDAAAKFNADAYTDFMDLLKRDDIDLISVCTPSGLHCDMALEIGRAGKHVLCEKPLDINLNKIMSTVKFFEDNNLKLGCIFQNRMEPANRKIKQAVEEGRLGKLTLATASIKWYRTQDYYNENGRWRGTWAMDGGGSLMNQSVHTIDLMQWIMGPVKSVVGVTKVWNHDIETEDMGVALVKFENGAFGTITGSTATYPGFNTCLEIHGINGGIYMENNHIKSWKIKGHSMDDEETEVLSQYGAEGRKPAQGVSDPNSIKGDTTFMQIQDMVYSVRDGRYPVIPGREGKNAVEIILAIYKSAKSGKEVFI